MSFGLVGHGSTSGRPLLFTSHQQLPPTSQQPVSHRNHMGGHDYLGLNSSGGIILESVSWAFLGMCKFPVRL